MESKRFYTNPGSPIEPIYEGKLQKDGSIELVEVGKRNIQEYIDSFREDAEIDNIIARFNNGDLSALSRSQGFYDDITKVPTNYAEILNMVYEGQKAFEILPVEIKKQFDNDFNKWFTSVGTDIWHEKMSVLIEKEKENVVEEKVGDSE